MATGIPLLFAISLPRAPPRVHLGPSVFDTCWQEVNKPEAVS